jgi:CheY-like chemotaxis protein
LEETASLLRASLPASIEIRATVQSPVPRIYGNRALIQQVLINLATNAYQAIGNRPGLVEIMLDSFRVEASSPTNLTSLPPGLYARIRVKDNGPGIEAELLERIFEPFFTTKGPGEGTGLGLSVVHGIVQAHDGRIAVESIPGQGTLFEIHFPASTPDSTTTTLDAPPLQNARPTGRLERVMLVDDEKSLLRVEERVLKMAGYHVSAYLDPLEALGAFLKAPNDYQLIVTDYSMPGLTGVDLALRIREVRQDLPMILCTGYGAGLTLDRARTFGFHAVLQKPVELQSLCNSVRNAIDDPKLVEAPTP